MGKVGCFWSPIEASGLCMLARLDMEISNVEHVGYRVYCTS